MSVLTVITDETQLRKVSTPVELPLTENELKFVIDLRETMEAYGGVGISAPQVGIAKRIVIVDFTPGNVPTTKSGRPLWKYVKELINPEILWESEVRTEDKEGCLSFPGKFLRLQRASKIKVRAIEIDGATRTFESSGRIARCVLHEIDHLNGVLFIDTHTVQRT